MGMLTIPDRMDHNSPIRRKCVEAAPHHPDDVIVVKGLRHPNGDEARMARELCVMPVVCITLNLRES